MQRKQVADINRAVNLIDKFFLNTQLLFEHFQGFFGGVGLDFQPDRHLVGAVFYLGFNGFQQVHDFIFMEVVIVIPSNAKAMVFLIAIPGKAPECACE